MLFAQRDHVLRPPEYAAKGAFSRWIPTPAEARFANSVGTLLLGSDHLYNPAIEQTITVGVNHGSIRRTHPGLGVRVVMMPVLKEKLRSVSPLRSSSD